jgi:hypothetical protein
MQDLRALFQFGALPEQRGEFLIGAGDPRLRARCLILCEARLPREADNNTSCATRLQTVGFPSTRGRE